MEGNKKDIKIKEFYTTGEAAKQLRVSRRTVINWIEKGWMVCSQRTLGGCRRIEPEELSRIKFKTGVKD